MTQPELFQTFFDICPKNLAILYRMTFLKIQIVFTTVYLSYFDTCCRLSHYIPTGFARVALQLADRMFPRRGQPFIHLLLTHTPLEYSIRDKQIH